MISTQFDKDGNGALSVSELQNAADAYVKQLPGIVSLAHPSISMNEYFHPQF
jgi:hypothetical protein